MEMGDIGWVPPLGSEESCGINNYGPTLDTVRPNLYGRFAGESELCAWIRAGKPIDGTKLIEAATRKKEAAEQRLQTAKDTLSEAELKITESQTALDQANEALQVALKGADEDEKKRIAKKKEEEDRIAEEKRLADKKKQDELDRFAALKEEREAKERARKEAADEILAGAVKVAAEKLADEEKKRAELMANVKALASDAREARQAVFQKAKDDNLFPMGPEGFSEDQKEQILAMRGEAGAAFKAIIEPLRQESRDVVAQADNYLVEQTATVAAAQLLLEAATASQAAW
jgi:hypothetical protein